MLRTLFSICIPSPFMIYVPAETAAFYAAFTIYNYFNKTLHFDTGVNKSL